MILYKGHRIGSTPSIPGVMDTYFYIQSLRGGIWTDLFFGLKSIEEAKKGIDDWSITVKVVK